MIKIFIPIAMCGLTFAGKKSALGFMQMVWLDEALDKLEEQMECVMVYSCVKKQE